MVGLGLVEARRCVVTLEWYVLDPRVINLLPKGGVLVDLGCGAGAWLDAVASSYETVIGIDVSTRRLEREGRAPASWRFVEADMDAGIPLDTASVDAVTANQVAEHVRDPVAWAREVHRILRPGGVFVLATPNVRYIRNIGRIVIQGTGPRTGGNEGLDGPWDNGHLHYFTHSDVKTILGEAGFARVDSRALVARDGRLAGLRSMFDQLSGSFIVREFLSGNILAIGRKGTTD